MDIPKNKIGTGRSWKKWNYKAIIIPVIILVIAILPVEMFNIPPSLERNESIQELQTLLKENKTEEAMLASMINGRVNSLTSLYNLAVSLEHMGELAEAATILQKIYNNVKSKDNFTLIEITEKEMSEAADIEIEILKEIFKSKKLEQQLKQHNIPAVKNTRLFLLKLYFRLGKDEEVKRIVKEIASVNQVLETLSLPGTPNYFLDLNGHKMNLHLGTEENEIVMDDPSVDIDLSLLPQSLQRFYLWRTNKILASGGIDLPNLDFLELMNTSILSHFQTFPLLREIDIHFSILDVSLLPPSVQKLSLKKAKVYASGAINLPNLKYLDLTRMDSSSLVHFQTAPLKDIRIFELSSLELALLPKSVQKLHLYKVEEVSVRGRIEMPNLKYLQVIEMYSYWLPSVVLPQLQELEVSDSFLPISLLPQSLQKLTLRRATLLVNRGIGLSNLKYLQLEKMDSKYFSKFQSEAQLTHIQLLGMVGELNVDLLAPNVTTVEISSSRTQIIGGVRKVDKLILDFFSVDHVDRVFCHLKPKLLVISYTYEPREIIALLDKQIETIAVGTVNWKKEDFNNSTLSKHVDRQSEFYLLEGGRGKAIEGKQYDELLKFY